MFDAYCTACDRRWLVTVNQVTGIVNDDAGIHVVYRCRCGADGVWHTGRAHEEPAEQPGQPVLARAS